MNRTSSFHQGGPARVLMLIDQQVIADTISLTLNHGIYVTRGARTVAQAKAILDEWQPHVAVIDMDVAGDRFVKEASTSTRGSAERLPVLALTRRGDLKTKLAAFELGVDDIMTVPFSPEELLARVLALTRRTYGDMKLSPVITVGELEIDILDRKVHAGASTLHLTSVEQSLLYLLAANTGKLLTRNDIMDALWGVDYVAESNVVDRHIRNLRAKLQNDWRKPRFIETVPGQGYRFIATFSESDESSASQTVTPAERTRPAAGSARSVRRG